jgi:hypothetical protein
MTETPLYLNIYKGYHRMILRWHNGPDSVSHVAEAIMSWYRQGLIDGGDCYQLAHSARTLMDEADRMGV